MRKFRPWLISIPGLRQGENRLKFDLDIEELGGTSREVAENPSFEELLGPVHVDLAIVRTGQKLLVNGRAIFEVRLSCALCGQRFQERFSEELVTEYVNEEETAVGERELDWEELGQEMVHGNLLNLIGVVRDAIHLAIPIAPRCRPDCRGLCPVCGANLNETCCGCLGVV